MVVKAATKIRYLLSTITVLLVACGPAANQEPAPLAHDAHWGYQGDVAPEYWADLDPDFALCRVGKEQSPIDLTNAVPIEDSGIRRRLGDTVLALEGRAHVMDLVDNGHTIQVTNDTPMTIELGETHYELVQYHFHAPSEHTIDGEHAPLEIHFVHKSAAGGLAVLGMLVEEGEHNVILEPVIAALPDGPDDARHIEGLELDMNELRPMPQRYYRYNGSLTTPPCSEEVRWLIMVDKRQVSAEQMKAIVSRLHHNNRPVQPLGERAIGLVLRD